MKKSFSVTLLGILVLVGSVSHSAENPVPNYPYEKVRQFLDKKKWPEAIEELRGILKVEPRSLKAITELSTALTYNGNRTEALSLLNASAKNSKGTEKNYFIRRSKVLSRLFLTNKTFQAYQDGLNFMMTKKYSSARERIEKALISEPDNVEILTRLAQCMILDKEPVHAIPKLELAAQLNPFQPEIHLWLGRALFLMNKISESITELTVAHNQLQGSELSPLWLSDALSSAGQGNAALKLLELDVKQWPLHVLSLMSLARIRIQMPKADASSLWAARKELQLAMSRMEEYLAFIPQNSKNSSYSGSLDRFNDLGTELSKDSGELKSEIQKLQQQVESRLGQLSDHR